MRGPCLADGVYEEWATPTCRDVTARFVAASVRAAELHLAAGRVDAAVRHARLALATDQLRAGLPRRSPPVSTPRCCAAARPRRLTA